MKTPPPYPDSLEESLDDAAATVTPGTGLSLARIVIILYITGLVAAMIAANTLDVRLEPGESAPPPNGVIAKE